MYIVFFQLLSYVSSKNLNPYLQPLLDVSLAPCTGVHVSAEDTGSNGTVTMTFMSSVVDLSFSECVTSLKLIWLCQSKSLQPGPKTFKEYWGAHVTAD